MKRSIKHLTITLCLFGSAHLQARNKPVLKPRAPSPGHIYVTNSLDNTVTVIDAATNTQTATVHVGSRPGNLTADSGGVYVGNLDNTVSVINPATNTVAKTIQIPLSPFSYCCGRVFDVSISPDGSTLYIAAGEGGIAEVNTTTDAVVFVNRSNTDTVTVAPNGNVYVLVDYQLSEMSPVSMQVGGNFPIKFTVSPDSKTVYLLRFDAVTGDDEISIINASTGAQTGFVSFPSGLYASDMVVSPDNGTLYVSNQGGNNVLEINVAARVVSKTIAVGKTPAGIAVDKNTGRVYVVNSGDNSLSVIDPVAGVVVAVVSVGSGAGKVVVE